MDSQVPRRGLSYRLTRRRFLARAAGGVAAGAAVSGVYAWRFEPHWVEYTERAMPLAGLDPALDGKRLVQLSDLHVGPTVDNDYLRQVLRSVAGIEPDFLAITGDFMTCERSEQVDATLDTLRELPLAKTPTVAALGNHDFGASFHHVATARALTDGLRRLGVEVLRNESVTIDGLQFAGSGELWAGECDVWRVASTMDNAKPTVFLAHNPDTADVSGWGTMHGWILSGHTHGGQCRFPLIGRPVLPIRNRAYAAGYVRLDDRRRLYVNRGVGYARRVRFGARPEVTVFTLERRPPLA